MKRTYYFNCLERSSVHFALLALFCFGLTLLNGQVSNDFDPIIEKYSIQYGVDKNVVKSLIQVSSGGNPRARSQDGDIGLMQLTPTMIRNMRIQNPYNPDENIRGGCGYLKTFMNQFGNMEMAVAAFNAGPEAVQKYGGIPPYAETRIFVRAVMKIYQTLKEKETESSLHGSSAGTARDPKHVSTPPLSGSATWIVTAPEINPNKLDTSRAIGGGDIWAITDGSARVSRNTFKEGITKSVDVSAPPSTLRPGDRFNVTISVACTKGTGDEYCCAEGGLYTEGITCTPARDTPRQRISTCEPDFAGSKSLAYSCTVTASTTANTLVFMPFVGTVAPIVKYTYSKAR